MSPYDLEAPEDGFSATSCVQLRLGRHAADVILGGLFVQRLLCKRVAMDVYRLEARHTFSSTGAISYS